MINGGRTLRCVASVSDETERVPCRIREDTPTPLSVSRIEQCGAPFEDLFLGFVQVLDPQVEVELLRPSGIRPPWRPMIFNPLEGQHEPAVGMERRPAVAERPPRIRLVHNTADK